MTFHSFDKRLRLFSAKTPFFGGILPLLLLVVLMLVMVLTVFSQASTYSLTTDEAIHDSYGQSVLEWYLTAGRDKSFLHYPADTYEPQHGALFDVVVAAAQRVFHHQWYTEAVLIGLAALLGVFGFALCGLELAGWWCAFCAALSLWLYPRFFGALFNNPKDIPFTAANIFVLWCTLRLLRGWHDPQTALARSAWLACALAVAIAVRINAVTWYFLLVVLLGGWWLWNWRLVSRERLWQPVIRQQMLAGLLLGPGSFLGVMLLWPYIFLNPVANFYTALVVMAKYPWNGSVLFQGKMQLAVDLPRSFAPVWLLIGSPPLLIAFAIFGLLAACYWCVRHRTLDIALVLVVLSFLIPFGMIVALHSVLYNGLRQFLFLIPSLILIAVYGFLRLSAFLWCKKRLIAFGTLLLLALLNQVWVVRDMLEIHPYEYAYFSPLIGGLPGASGQFEIDYWNTCQKAASEWLAANYQSYITTSPPTIQAATIAFQYMTFLPANFVAVAENPDFLIAVQPLPIEQGYRLIHTEGIAGVTLCQIYIRNSIDMK